MACERRMKLAASGMYDGQAALSIHAKFLPHPGPRTPHVRRPARWQTHLSKRLVELPRSDQNPGPSSKVVPIQTLANFADVPGNKVSSHPAKKRNEHLRRHIPTLAGWQNLRLKS